MPPPILVLAHAPQTQAVADRIGADLAGLGFTVDRGEQLTTRRAEAARIEAAHKVVVLWSRAARGTPALRAAVRRARAKGTLVCVALDAAPPPGGVGQRLPRSGGAWRKVLLCKRASTAHGAATTRAYPRPAKARREAKPRIEQPRASSKGSPAPRRKSASLLAALMALALIVAAAATEAYARDAAFAARVQALADAATAQVTQLAMAFAAQR
jgi:hypothetical protein